MAMGATGGRGMNGTDSAPTARNTCGWCNAAAQAVLGAFVAAPGDEHNTLRRLFGVPPENRWPNWEDDARFALVGMARYTAVFYGCLALGSVFWGQVASRTGLTLALLIAALGTLAGLAFAARLPLRPKA